MADALTITIDGIDYRIPDDLNLNDVAAFEEQGWVLGDTSSMTAVRFLVHRLLLRTDPGITLEEAGAKVPLSVLVEQAEEEPPPPIPLSEPEAQSGTSSDGSKGNGSTGGSAVTEIRGAVGQR